MPSGQFPSSLISCLISCVTLLSPPPVPLLSRPLTKCPQIRAASPLFFVSSSNLPASCSPPRASLSRPLACTRARARPGPALALPSRCCPCSARPLPPPPPPHSPPPPSAGPRVVRIPLAALLDFLQPSAFLASPPPAAPLVVTKATTNKTRHSHINTIRKQRFGFFHPFLSRPRPFPNYCLLLQLFSLPCCSFSFGLAERRKERISPSLSLARSVVGIVPTPSPPSRASNAAAAAARHAAHAKPRSCAHNVQQQTHFSPPIMTIHVTISL